MSALACDPAYVLTEYEALRREATTITPAEPRGHGLVLFLTRGLPGWLAALTALGPSSAPPPDRLTLSVERAPRLQPSARTALTTVLAGMVLACTREAERGCR
jgi:hypothetical protein